jgi:hypothetical protein
VTIRRRLSAVGEPLPAAALPGVAGRFDLSKGEHPSLVRGLAAFHRLDPLSDPAAAANLGGLELPYGANLNGHHMVVDQGYLAAAGSEDAWPLAPAFVRDLAGRVIHTGLNPLPVLPQGPLMPFTCRPLDPAAPGADLLERVFLTSFRRLEIAHEPGMALTGREGTLLRAAYVAPHRYPYKLRVDSFYVDGFRLPQVERLYVTDADGAAAAQSLMARWRNRPEGQAYEDFHETNGGNDWVEDMFRQGCTLIPTTEGYNGYYRVGADFGMEDVWPGCAVEGLHEVSEIRADARPAGTILEVRAPGYATRGEIRPAQVVVSDGSLYRTPHASDPDPLWPDKRLPHPRLSAGADVWLPTHPSHFEVPALWDWDAEGHFLQVAGPLWDPVHYVYAGAERIIRAFRHGWEQNPALAPVPEDMVSRFHPAVGMTTYDTASTTTGLFRRRQPLQTPLSPSALDTVPLGRKVCGVGYHPLPAILEYELDPFAFPELSPRHLQPGTPPGAPAPVIAGAVTVAEGQKLLTLQPEPARQWSLQPALWPEGEGYPGLARYTPESPPPESPARIGFCCLPDLPTSELMVNVKRFFANRGYRNALDALGEGVREAMFAFREESLAWRRLRHRVARKYPGWYLWLWWGQHNPSQVHDKLRDAPDEGLIPAEMLLQTQPGIEKAPARPAGGTAGGLPKAAPRLGRNGFTGGGGSGKLSPKAKNQAKAPQA